MTETIKEKYYEMGQQEEVDLDYYFEYFASKYDTATTMGKIWVLEAVTSLLREINKNIGQIWSEDRVMDEKYDNTNSQKIADYLDKFDNITTWIYEKLCHTTERAILRTVVIFLITYRGTFFEGYPNLNKRMDDFHSQLSSTNTNYLTEYLEIRETIKLYKK